MFYRENSYLSTAPIFCLYKKIFAIFQHALDFLFPQKCLACKKEGFAFCSFCRGRIPWETSLLPDEVLSVWQYENPTLQKALWRLKYRGKQELAHDLAESMYDKLMETLSENDIFADPTGKDTKKYLIIPIPLHKKRQKERGYNQSELLGKELANLNPELFLLENKILVKTKETKSQVSVKNKEERLKNIRGSFNVLHTKKITGKDIIIVDDVTTTGATLTEARKVLRKAGAKSVVCITLAH